MLRFHRLAVFCGNAPNAVADGGKETIRNGSYAEYVESLGSIRGLKHRLERDVGALLILPYWLPTERANIP